MTDTPHTPTFPPMVERFRGYLPVVVDVETGGFDWNKHALLEIAAVPIELDEAGNYMPGAVAHAHIAPAPGTSPPRIRPATPGRAVKGGPGPAPSRSDWPGSGFPQPWC